jgi:hypothetical protein
MKNRHEISTAGKKATLAFFHRLQQFEIRNRILVNKWGKLAIRALFRYKKNRQKKLESQVQIQVLS